jgi:hypothetical protein
LVFDLPDHLNSDGTCPEVEARRNAVGTTERRQAR